MVVVGAGFAGCLAACLLRAQGRNVCVVDQEAGCADVFRAEKLEPEQADGLAALGQLDAVRHCLTPIREVGALRDGVLQINRYERHYAMRYPDLVNALRRRVEEQGGIRVQRVTAIASDADGCLVRFADGSELRGGLCVLATGSVTSVARAGLPVTIDEGISSLNIGFDVRPADEKRSVPLAFNYYSSRPHRDGLHYVTFFPIDEIVRVNAFTAWHADDRRIPQFASDPVETLHHLLPRLRKLYGSLHCVSRVRTARTRYHHVDRATPGVLAIGEAFQSVSPATGMGLSKCLTDVRVLLRHAEQWPHEGPIHEPLIAAFYADPEKVRMDEEALDAWRWFCASVHDRSLRWRIKRGVGAALRWAMAGRGRSRRQAMP